MKLKGAFQSASDRRLRVMLGAHLLWLLLVFLLGTWWGNLVLGQAKRIADLESALGMSSAETLSHWHKTQRMLHWEGAFFSVLLLASTVFLFWLYWRDVKRANGIEAFFASVTHELRTPLTSIRLQAESIAEAVTTDQLSSSPLALGALTERLLEDSVRLATQVERTLELARLEGGGPVYTQALQLKPWLERFVRTSDYLKSIEFKTDLADKVIEADPVALHVILKNLFENSIKHSRKERVQMTLRTGIQKPGEVSLSLKDDGPGQDEKIKGLGNIFQKGPRSQGAGVGLYLVKTLMTRMQGHAEFNPCADGFEVRLTFQEGESQSE